MLAKWILVLQGLLVPLALSAAGPDISPAERYFTNVLLTDQNGAQLRLYSDLLKGKVVVVNNFFATCKDSCPIMANNLAAIQERFKDRLGKDLYILSVSVDPARDNPAVLKQYAEKMHARAGWYFLTGPTENVEFALLRLGQKINQREDHTNLFFIGNDRTGLWKKAMGMASKQELIEIVDSVLNDGK
jgi:cytochrome oxidase Cu insertion factor (SCO1/SenC/PrrC family)